MLGFLNQGQKGTVFRRMTPIEAWKFPLRCLAKEIKRVVTEIEELNLRVTQKPYHSFEFMDYQNFDSSRKTNDFLFEIICVCKVSDWDFDGTNNACKYREIEFDDRDDRKWLAFFNSFVLAEFWYKDQKKLALESSSTSLEISNESPKSF